MDWFQIRVDAFDLIFFIVCAASLFLTAVGYVLYWRVQRLKAWWAQRRGDKAPELPGGR
jgi:hypothetical protein